MDKTPELKALLKQGHTYVKDYVLALEKENMTLQRQIVKLQAQQITLNNRVKALEKESKKHSGARDLGDVLRGISERRKAEG